MALYYAFALPQLGWALSQQGKMPGLDEIERGLREADRINAGRLDTLNFSLAADAYARAGMHDESRANIGKAFSALTRNGDLAFAAELHRMRATLLLRAERSAQEAAETDLRRALEIGQQQEALSLELRAARDLALLLAEGGERQQATDLLAPVYGKFTEGFETLDLKEAQALLDAI
jgi:predicted ATPase